MTMYSNCVQVFDPMYTYNRVAETLGEQDALRSFLRFMADSRIMEDKPAKEQRYPLQSAYYRYKPYLVVLLERDHHFYCQTYIDGVPYALLDAELQKEELELFFTESRGRITVLDNVHGREFKPQFQYLEQYMRTVREFREALEQQRDTVREYSEHCHQMMRACEDMLDEDPTRTYNRACKLLDQYIVLMNATINESCLQKQRQIKDCCVPMDDWNATLYMFGLYAYALQYGLMRGRFLRRISSSSVLFGNLLRDMHAFMQKNDEIEVMYCEEMELPENEQLTLEAMLEREGLTSASWYRIGDDLF